MRKRFGVLGLILAANLGIGAAYLHNAYTPTSTQGIREQIRQAAANRVEVADVEAIRHPCWRHQQELLQALCDLRDAERALATEQGDAPTTWEHLAPTVKQEALFARLAKTARTEEQRRWLQATETRLYGRTPADFPAYVPATKKTLTDVSGSP